MNKPARLFLVCLSAALVLSGCGKKETPPGPSGTLTGPKPAESQPDPAEPSISPETPNPGIATEDTEDYEWSSYVWTQAGEVAVRRHMHMDFISADGQITHTFTPNLDSWQGAPDAFIWGESFCSYTLGERYVLAVFTFYGNPAVMLDGDTPTLVDAAILDLEGNVVRAFPRGATLNVNPAMNNADFQASLNRRTRFYWVTDELLAVSTGAELWFYDLAADTLTQKADYTDAVFTGWTSLESQGYGLTEDAAWAIDGALYFTLGEGYTADTSYNPRCSLWRADKDGAPVRLSGEDYFTAFRHANGRLFAELLEGRLEPNGGTTPLYRFWHMDTEGDFAYIDTVANYFRPIARQDVVGCFDTLPTDLTYLYVAYELRGQNLLSGDRYSFVPTAENGGFPESVRLITTFDLIDVAQTEGGMRFYYAFVDMAIERPESADFDYYIACHDTATGQTAFTKLNTDILDVPPGSDFPGLLLAIEPTTRAIQFVQMPEPS